MREEFHIHETYMIGYLVYSLDNCVMKLCIETGLKLGRFVVITQIFLNR